MAGVLQVADPPRVAGGVAAGQPGTGVRRAVVHQKQFPVGVALREDTLDSLPDEPFGVPEYHHDRYQRRGAHLCLARANRCKVHLAPRPISPLAHRARAPGPSWERRGCWLDHCARLCALQIVASVTPCPDTKSASQLKKCRLATWYCPAFITPAQHEFGCCLYLNQHSPATKTGILRYTFTKNAWSS